MLQLFINKSEKCLPTSQGKTQMVRLQFNKNRASKTLLSTKYRVIPAEINHLF